MRSLDRNRTSVLCHYCDQFARFKRKCPVRIEHQQQQQQPVRHHQQQQHGQHLQKPPRRRQNNGGGGGGRVWCSCSYHKITSHNNADCRVHQQNAGGNAHVAAARTQRVKRFCNAYDLRKEDDEPERPYLSFTATEVQSKTETATAPRQKNGTWPLCPLTAARPWPFVEREKPAFLLGGQDEPDLSYRYGGPTAKENHCSTARP